MSTVMLLMFCLKVYWKALTWNVDSGLRRQLVENVAQWNKSQKQSTLLHCNIHRTSSNAWQIVFCFAFVFFVKHLFLTPECDPIQSNIFIFHVKFIQHIRCQIKYDYRMNMSLHFGWLSDVIVFLLTVEIIFDFYCDYNCDI